MGGIIEANENRKIYATLAGIYPSLPHCSSVSSATYLALEQLASSTYSNSRTRGSVSEKYGADDGPMGQVGRFLTAHIERPDYFTARDVLMGSLTNILAGSDTTAISLSAILHYLCTHSEKMQKLRDEIDGMAKRGQVSDPVTLKETQAMPYL